MAFVESGTASTYKARNEITNHLIHALERGDYDWSYQAMDHWPERVREKCKTNRSYAIAHGLE